jgi:hypothetical protein
MISSPLCKLLLVASSFPKLEIIVLKFENMKLQAAAFQFPSKVIILNFKFEFFWVFQATI